MRPNRGVVILLAAPAVIAVACGSSPSPRPTAALPVAPDAAADAPTLARQCTPWPEPPAAAPPDPAVDPASGRHATPTNAKDLCETADTNLARAEARIEGGAAGVPVKSTPWDHRQKPQRLDLVEHRYKLTKREQAMLGQNGFVVLERREYATFSWALHDVYQSQLPLYVSADAILHAVFSSNDHLVAQLERDLLVPLLGRTLAKLHCTLADVATSYPPEVARDLDLYLTVARSLLVDAPVPSVLGTDAQAAELVAAAKKASGIATLSLFGRDRLLDWSAYLPRGHYAPPGPPEHAADDTTPEPPASEPAPLAAYFRSAMWLSRIEMNLVSRSSRSSSPAPAPDPSETPREAIAALALADLVDRAHGVDDVARLDRAWTLLAGRREDVTVADLVRLRAKMHAAKIDLAAYDELKAAIGNDFQRTARLHPMPEGSSVLPAITTLLGPRVVADTAAFRPLVNGEVPQRYLVGAGDVAYVLGLDRGKAYLADDLKKFPSLAAQLDVARGVLRAAPDAGDLYGAWLAAVRGIAAPAPATAAVPSFMRTTAYDDLRVGSLVAGYGQIRHNYVLMAGQSYDEGGCHIPDGWVEPLPAVYENLTTYAERGVKALAELDPKDATGSGRYFAELAKITRVLATIAHHEIEGRALSDDEKRFLAMVVEMTPGGTGGPPTYTGWYFDLFRGRQDEALASAAFTADYHTSTSLGKVVYAGAAWPRLGLFVVDVGGPPRIMVGPVANAYGMVGTVERRFDDRTGAQETQLHASPWAASYTAPPPPRPDFALAANLPYETRTIKMVLRSKAALSGIVIEATDHHGVALTTLTKSLPANGRLVLSVTPPRQAEGLRVRIGEHVIEGSVSGPSTSVSLESGDLRVDSEDWAATNE